MGLMKRLYTARLYGIPIEEPKPTTAFDHLKGENREKRDAGRDRQKARRQTQAFLFGADDR